MEPLPFNEEHYSELRRRTIIRLLLTYIAPLLLLVVYFWFQYNSIVAEGRRLHLQAIAENQANTLNLFLTERLINLSNLIDDPELRSNPSNQVLQKHLGRLKRISETFVDLGYFDSSGIQIAYAGPYPALENRDYSNETWWLELETDESDFVITDIYLGFRQRAHFTMAVNRFYDGRYVVLRATLDPEKIYDYIRSLEGSQEVLTSIVNKEGFYQVVTPGMGSPLQTSSIVPPREPRIGVEEVTIDGEDIIYAYSWLPLAEWGLIAQQIHRGDENFLSGFLFRLLVITILITAILVAIILNRTRKLVEMQRDTDGARAQLGHAAKLASVGELAAGIAHEINNPLAVITEESGLTKDLMNPEFGRQISREEIIEHLDSISEAAFRCRDITRKLLGFVRQTEFNLARHNIHDILDGVLDGLLGPEISVSNIKVIRKYGEDIPEITTDGNQLQQVFLNLINNAMDAIGRKAGKIIVATRTEGKKIIIEVSDTGKGISPENLSRVFMPFFTTKEVGRGTGLGLSVSYGIIKNLGGEIKVASEVGRGTTFTITLPIH